MRRTRGCGEKHVGVNEEIIGNNSPCLFEVKDNLCQGCEDDEYRFII